MEGVIFEGVDGPISLWRTYLPQGEGSKTPVVTSHPSGLSEYERQRLDPNDPNYIPSFTEWVTSPVKKAYDAVAAVPGKIAWGVLIAAAVVGILMILGTRLLNAEAFK